MHWADRRQRFRALLAGDRCYHPGSVFDPISARIAEDLGFEIGMFAGSVASMTVLGAPDLIVLTLSEFAAQAYRINRAGNLPLIVIWFGIDEFSKVLLIYLACFAPLAMSARAGVRSVSQEQIHAAYSMGASRWQVIWHVIVPGAMPEILTAMRISIGFGWTTLVAAEMVAATHGLGQMVLNASNFLRTDIVIMGIVVIGFIAYLFDLLMRYVERVVVPWKGRV